MLAGNKIQGEELDGPNQVYRHSCWRRDLFSARIRLGQPWYIAVPLGLAGYLLTRFAGYLITEKKRG